MLHVLIVEDHEENRNLLKMLLEANGYRVTAAGDGLEALAAAQRDPPDVIVSDALMPRMDGFALCRAWMQDAALRAIPFIFYSATYVQPEDEQFAVALGAVRYLIKPLEAELFLQELRAVLQQWAGQPAPAPAAPLDENTARALHESALARKLEDKMAQLEAANRSLQESEARFRSLTEMSSDFYWESDAEHRLTQRAAADKKPSTVSAFERGMQIGERRWEIPYLSPDAAGWTEHRAMLDAHQPFRDFELSRLGVDGTERHISISGDPVFDASGAFKGYRGVGTDITTRKRAEGALLESEVQLNGILESTAEGILAVDSKGKVIRANRRFAEMWRIPRPLLDTRDDQALLDFVLSQLNDPEAFVKKVQTLYASDAEDMDTLAFKDGRTFERHSSPLILDGAILGRVWSFRDVTERKRVEEALRESAESLRAIFDGTLDGILVADAESGRFLTGNPEICRMLGYTLEEVVGIGVSDIHPKQELRRALEQFARLRRGEIQLAADTPVLRKDGTVFYADIKAAPIRLGGKNAMLGIFRDITERKRAEEDARARELRYEAVATSATDAFVTSDAAGRIVGWNPSAERIFGYVETEVMGQALTLLIPQRFHERHLDGMKRVQSGGERRVIGKTVELAGRRKDASEFPLELSLAEWSVGEGRFFTGIIRDITERKAAEAKIQRLTQLYAALSQCNEAIVRSASEKELFDQVCRAAVQFGGMKLAWIGMIEPDTRMLRFAASFGDHADEYLQGVEISIDADHPRGRGPSGTAVRENQPVWRQDFLHDPITAPWHARRARFGFGASASLPLNRNGVPVGVLTLYAGEVDAFDEAARRLLVEMATDIGFALDNFAHEAARARAEENLRAREEQFRGLAEQSIAGIYIIQDDKLAYVNRRYAEILGYDSADDLIGRHRLFMVPETDRAAITERILLQFEGRLNVAYDFSAVRKDGSTIEVGAHAARATHRGRPAIIGLMQDISEKKRAEEQIQRYVEQIQNAFMSTVQVVTSLGEMRDPYTAGHQRRAAEIAVAIGAELGFDARRQEGLRVAGYLHDVGKIRIPSEILSKPGKLSAVEFQLVQGHPRASYDVLKDVAFPWPVAEVALQHHERVDGSGYPQGLKGEAILLEARIMAVADVIEAMASHRPYRPGLGVEAALAEIERGRGSAYDTEVADGCLRLFRVRGYQLPE